MQELIRSIFVPKNIIGIDLGIKDLSVREYECPKCKSYLDRDFNAAVNIMFEGVKMYMNELVQNKDPKNTVVTIGIYVC